MDLCDIGEVRLLLQRHGFRFSKALGQNFLIDASIPARIAETSCADETCGVLEIGPGVGCLTRQLARRAGKVTAIELDRALLPVLDETLSGCPNAEVVQGDAMKLDLDELVRRSFAGLTPMVCANLPYNITTPLLTRLIRSGLFSSLTVMIQREVAQRICALPGTPEYGAYSLFCQYYTLPEMQFEVPPACFYPAPKVTSAVLRMTLRGTPPVAVADEELLFRVVRAAFGMRRKTLLNGLSSAFGGQLDKNTLRTVLTEAGLCESVRGETLGLPEYAALSDCLGKALQ